MNSSIDGMINDILEKIAKGYAKTKKEWLADRKNGFKDGKLFGYYEAKEALLSALDAETPLNDVLEILAAQYSRAKAEWLSDKRNAFKDGKFLASYEVLNMVPSAS